MFYSGGESARARASELVLVSKQLVYFDRYAKELAPDYNMARDLFLIQNVFPEAVARACAERGVTLPDDSIPSTGVVAGAARVLPAQGAHRLPPADPQARHRASDPA